MAPSLLSTVDDVPDDGGLLAIASTHKVSFGMRDGSGGCDCVEFLEHLPISPVLVEPFGPRSPAVLRLKHVGCDKEG